MATGHTAGAGLSVEQLQGIRDAVDAGRKPKVMFTESAGQIAGQIGQVVQLTDPAVSEEWLVVRFGRDELPFSPADLCVPPRGERRRGGARAEPETGAGAEPSVPWQPEPEFKVVRSVQPESRGSRSSASAAGEETSVSTVEQESGAAVPVAGGEQRPARRATKPARPKGPAGLTVTLTYADGEWTVAAAQGTKALAKPYVIKPAEALKMVGLIDVPGVQEAVEQILSAERAEAEQQAQRLRAELAEIEARLAELRDAH